MALSYRHAFHAGNHADVLKHLVLTAALGHLLEKSAKPLLYADTHAGPGMCALDRGPATRNTEYAGGIQALWDAPGLPDTLARYVELVRGFNPDGNLHLYPGSPALARQLMLSRAASQPAATGLTDAARSRKDPQQSPARRLDLCELHPDDHRRLTDWAGGDRHIHVDKCDGFARLKALLPPIERRALVLIDPPYELKTDYRAVLDAIEAALHRFATGVYLVWYPLLQRNDLPRAAQDFGSKLSQLGERWLRVELEVAPRTASGLYGSGIWICNPTFRLAQQLSGCRSELQRHLCLPGARGFRLDVAPGSAE